MVSFDVPGTDYSVTTDPDEADVVSTDDVTDGAADVGTTAGEGVQTGLRGALIQAPMSAGYSLRQGEATWLSGDEAGQGFGQAASGFGDAVEGAQEATNTEDNRFVGGGIKAADIVVGEGVRNVLGTTTGIDTEEGSADFDVTGWSLADTALTVGTLGAGSAGARAISGGARGADDAGRIGGRLGSLLGRGGDDAAEAGARAADDTPALQAADGAEESSTIGSRLSGLLGRGSDDAAQGGARTTDDASEGGSIMDNLGLSSSETVESGGSTATRATDGGEDLFNIGSRGGDDAARAADDTPALPAGQATDDGVSAAVRGSEDAATTGRRTSRSSSASRRGAESRRARAANEGTEASDDAVNAAVRGSDDAGRSSRSVTDARRPGTRAGRVGSRSADDAGRAGARGGNDVARAGARGADDAGSAASRSPATRAGQFGARSSDEGASIGGRIRNALWGTRKRQAGSILSGTFLAGAGLEQAGLLPSLGGLGGLPGEQEVPVETEDGRSLLLHHVENLDPTEEHPGGGQLREVEEFAPDGNWSETTGYTVLLDVAGNTVTILDDSGEPMQAEISAGRAMQAVNRAEGDYYENE